MKISKTHYISINWKIRHFMEFLFLGRSFLWFPQLFTGSFIQISVAGRLVGGRPGRTFTLRLTNCIVQLFSVHAAVVRTCSAVMLWLRNLIRSLSLSFRISRYLAVDVQPSGSVFKRHDGERVMLSMHTSAVTVALSADPLKVGSTHV